MISCAHIAILTEKTKYVTHALKRGRRSPVRHSARLNPLFAMIFGLYGYDSIFL